MGYGAAGSAACEPSAENYSQHHASTYRSRHTDGGSLAYLRHCIVCCVVGRLLLHVAEEQSGNLPAVSSLSSKCKRPAAMAGLCIRNAQVRTNLICLPRQALLEQLATLMSWRVRFSDPWLTFALGMLAGQAAQS